MHTSHPCARDPIQPTACGLAVPMHGAGEGLTALTVEELKRLLHYLHTGDLVCPISIERLTIIGFQSRYTIVSGALRGLETAAVRAVLVCTIAERTRDAPKVGPIPSATRAEHLVSERSVSWSELRNDGILRLRRKQLAKAAGGQGIGFSVVELQAGQRSWPYHYHLGNEEALYVVTGRPLVRLADKIIQLEPGDYLALPPGSASGHQMINGGASPCRYLCVSTMQKPDVVCYPDSRKIGVFAGAAPGGDETQRTVSTFMPRASAVDYWDGED